MENIRVVVVNILGPVGMVRIRINNRTAQIAAFQFAQVLDHHRFVVDRTKTAGAVDNPHAVVTRRAEQGKSPPGLAAGHEFAGGDRAPGRDEMGLGDRKSTRLNSSHVRISYAVFCLKKKKKNYFAISPANIIYNCSCY